jgi:CHAT domain-containing protein
VLVEARLNRARALLAVGRPGEAQADLAQGEQLLKRVGDAAMLNRFGADLLAARAEAYLESSPVTAYRDAMTALARIRNAGSEFRFAQLRLLAGRAALNLGDEGDAVRQFEHGIAHLESRRAVIQQRNLRVSFMDSVWSLYEERIQCAVRRGAHAEAVSWVERSRARMLLDELKGVGRPTLTATKPGHALLLFVAGPQQLLGWLVTNRSLDFAAVPVPAATLRGQVKRLTKSLEAREADSVRQLARSLGAVVVDPLNLTGRGLSVLAISPGDALEAVPFAALIDRRGSHVVRSVATVVVPSGSTLAAVRPKARPMERLALIGEPQLHGVSRSATLLGARAEAAAIRELYPSSVMVEGAAATPRAFLAALEDADVVHFAGHAVGDASRPWQARLLLSGSTSDDDGALTLAQLRAGRSLAEVVVLAACDTGTGSGSAGEGLLSLSRPLLASGVRSVVVSKWRVVDDDMRVLNQAFHVHLRKPGAGPAAALRHAQLALLEAGGPHAAVHVWAMLEVQGSIN